MLILPTTLYLLLGTQAPLMHLYKLGLVFDKMENFLGVIARPCFPTFLNLTSV